MDLEDDPRWKEAEPFIDGVPLSDFLSDGFPEASEWIHEQARDGLYNNYSTVSAFWWEVLEPALRERNVERAQECLRRVEMLLGSEDGGLVDAVYIRIIEWLENMDLDEFHLGPRLTGALS